MSSFNNQAALLVAYGKPLELGQGPTQGELAANEILVKASAIAINPVDWKVQAHPFLELDLPHVLGSDIAGTVVKIGSAVTRFTIGDRVIGHCGGLSYGGARHGSFQNYAILRDLVTAKIPANLSFEQASVLPLGISTAAVGLFEILKLQLPTVDNASREKLGTVVIWGGASSVGMNAIQLAAAAGYDIITTASAKNHDHLRTLVSHLGTNITISDYADPEIVEQIVLQLKNSESRFEGLYDAISTEPVMRACANIVSRLGGGVFSVVLPPLEDFPEGVSALPAWSTNAAMVPNHPGAAVWKDFVPVGLENGTFKAEPRAKVVGQGLESINAAMEEQKAGVSAVKLVVSM